MGPPRVSGGCSAHPTCRSPPRVYVPVGDGSPCLSVNPSPQASVSLVTGVSVPDGLRLLCIQKGQTQVGPRVPTGHTRRGEAGPALGAAAEAQALGGPAWGAGLS